MAKLADALASGASDSNIMEVQVLSTAPFLFLRLILQLNMRLWRNWQTRYFEGVVFTRRMGSSPINRTRNYPDVVSGFFIAPKQAVYRRVVCFLYVFSPISVKICVGTAQSVLDLAMRILQQKVLCFIFRFFS